MFHVYESFLGTCGRIPWTEDIPFAMASDVFKYKTVKNAFGIGVSTVLCCLETAEVL